MPDLEPPEMDARLCDHDPVDFVPRPNEDALYFRGRPEEPKPPELTFLITEPGQPPRTLAVRAHFIKIGKLASSHLHLSDPEVSRMHAVIEVGADCAYIIDLGSTRGTIVNGGRVNKCRLNNGDIVDVGSTRLVIRIAPPKDAPDTGELLRDAFDENGRYDAAKLTGLLDWTNREMTDYLGVDPSGITRNAASLQNQEALARLAALMQHLLTLLENKLPEARAWLRTPIRALDGKLPKEVILSGRLDVVANLLKEIEAGFQL